MKKASPVVEDHQNPELILKKEMTFDDAPKSETKSLIRTTRSRKTRAQIQVAQPKLSSTLLDMDSSSSTENEAEAEASSDMANIDDILDEQD